MCKALRTASFVRESVPLESSQPTGLLGSRGDEEDSGTGPHVFELAKMFFQKTDAERHRLVLTLFSQLLQERVFGGGRCVSKPQRCPLRSLLDASRHSMWSALISHPSLAMFDGADTQFD